jgi:CRP-like cAMP-binding protein
MAHRALACALERLAPFYRERMVFALARALADRSTGARVEHLRVLDAGEIERAHRFSAAMRARRDAALFERRLARQLAAVKKLALRLVGFVRRVAYEAEWRPNYCKHVSEPKPPKMLYGCKPSEAVRIAAERADQAVDADGKEIAYRRSRVSGWGGVIPSQVENDPRRQGRGREAPQMARLSHGISKTALRRSALLHPATRR